MYYVGSTGNLEDRLFRHNSGWSKSTKSGCPWQLAYSESFSTRSEAMKREKEIKNWKSHKRIAELISVSRSDGRVASSPDIGMLTPTK